MAADKVTSTNREVEAVVAASFAACAVDLRSAELHALSDGALETCFDPLADHRPLKLSKGA
ncbi:MAG TPA: hypothetical protein VKC66_27265, partial [Xanthobacteraceae bacterium]|nr:hypothetical protein [Xanthobacteraceae bacterium]